MNSRYHWFVVPELMGLLHQIQIAFEEYKARLDGDMNGMVESDHTCNIKTVVSYRLELLLI